MRFQVNIFTIFVSFFSLALAKPFFYNGPAALTSLVSSASAASSEPVSNISDLRLKKLELLQHEKLQENTDDGFLPDSEEDNNNEAAPSLLQKKINKILTKIRLISQFSAPTNSDNDNNNHSSSSSEDDFDKEIADFNKEYETDSKKTTEASAKSTKPMEKQVESEAAFQGYVYKVGGDPQRVYLDLAEPQYERQESGGKYEAGPAGFGVFFMELLGSIFGLAYGAAAQLTNPNIPAVTRAI